MSADSGSAGRPGRSVHQPVLLREIINWLDLSPGLVVVDGTIGGGGHSREILKRIGPTGTLVGLDRDPMMVDLSAGVLEGGNCHLVRASYADLEQVLEQLKLEAADRVLLDLGLSSDQLADRERGFSFESAGPLDLRFDPSYGDPAWMLLDNLDETAMASLFERNGEERHSRAIAREIIARCAARPVRTGRDLAEAVSAAVPGGSRRAGSRGAGSRHPATRVFQALRIAVNDELGHLQTALADVLPRCIRPGGRAVILSFHSLEDRLVKDAFRGDMRWRNLTAKPVTATSAEQRFNPRSRSAKLRAAIRV